MGTRDTKQILAFLREHKTELQEQFGVTRLGLVGSYARNEARTDSDIDLIVSLQSENTFPQLLRSAAFSAGQPPRAY